MMRFVSSAAVVIALSLLTGCVGAETIASANEVQGEPGIQGDQGIQGVQGIQGPAGVQGLRGFTGAAGATGATGTTGADGPVGSVGATGPAGPQGATGPAGPQGVAGPAGPAGIAEGYVSHSNWAQTAWSASWAPGYAMKSSLPAGKYLTTFTGYVTVNPVECSFNTTSVSLGTIVGGATAGNTLTMNAVLTLSGAGTTNWVNTYCKSASTTGVIDDATITLVPLGAVY